MTCPNLPYATIQRPIPLDERQRVWVEGFGPGQTFDRLTLGGATTGIGVLLDNGQRVTVSPREVRAIPVAQIVPEVLPGNVVKLRPRALPARREETF